MYAIIKGKIKEVEILEVFEKKSKVKVLKNGKIDTIFNIRILQTFEEAKLYQKEIKIARSFKEYSKNDEGLLECVYCKEQGEDLTVDHKRSLRFSGGRANIRSDYDTWIIAWDFSNLQICCKECNYKKNTASDVEYSSILRNLERKARALTYKKMNTRGKNPNKISFGTNVRGNEKIGDLLHKNNRVKLDPAEIDMYIARLDSRIIDKSLILR